MAIIRSRASSAAPAQVAIANPSVDRALEQWEERINQAREEGRKLGLAEAAADKAAAEQARADVQQVTAETETKIANAEQNIRHRLGQVIAALSEAIDETTALEEQALASAERDAVQLACRLAGAILHKEIQEPEWIQHVLTGALRVVPNKREVTVRLHTDDAKNVIDTLSQIKEATGIVGEIQVLADEHLASGSCVVESGGTRVDAGIPGSWERLSKRLLASAPDSDWSVCTVADPAHTDEAMANIFDQPVPAPTAIDSEPASEDTELNGDDDANA